MEWLHTLGTLMGCINDVLYRKTKQRKEVVYFFVFEDKDTFICFFALQISLLGYRNINNNIYLSVEVIE